jgi:hypothetical protein
MRPCNKFSPKSRFTFEVLCTHLTLPFATDIVADLMGGQCDAQDHSQDSHCTACKQVEHQPDMIKDTHDCFENIKAWLQLQVHSYAC